MRRLHWLAVALCAITGTASAQTGNTEPLYRSAFDGYRNWRADAPGDWKRANDEMKRLGGHVGHARAAAGSNAPAPAAAAPHAGSHGMRGMQGGEPLPGGASRNAPEVKR